MDTNKANDQAVVADVAEQKKVETETTKSGSPQDEKPITGAETTQEGEISKTSVEEQPDIESTMTEEQRRAFQDMRLENKRLKEEKESSKEEEPSAFDMFRAQTPPVGTTGPIRVENFQDPVTGETNWQAYNLAQQQREQNLLQQARFEAQQTVNEQMDENNARQKFPELFADRNTEKLIAAQWFFEKANGRDVPITQIASEFARNFKQAAAKAEKIGEAKVLNEVSEKEAATVEDSQTSTGAQANLSEDEQRSLGERTRHGEDEAITARISKIPWVNK